MYLCKIKNSDAFTVNDTIQWSFLPNVINECFFFIEIFSLNLNNIYIQYTLQQFITN